VHHQSTIYRLTLRATGVLMIALTGCQCMRENTFTGRLWESDEFRHFRGPDTNAPITVYAISGRDELLVVYKEWRDSADRARTRGLLLRTNTTPASPTAKPHFVSTNIPGLQPVSAGNHTTTPQVIVSSNNVVIYFPDGTTQRHVLPEYESSSGVVTKTALTPISLVGDATLVSLIAALIAAIAASHTGYSGDL
jgi:hypothetical protein